MPGIGCKAIRDALQYCPFVLSLSDDDTGLLELMAPLQEANQELIDAAALRTPHVQEGLIHACLGVRGLWGEVVADCIPPCLSRWEVIDVQDNVVGEALSKEVRCDWDS